MIALMRFQDDRVAYSPILLGVVVAFALTLDMVLRLSRASPRRGYHRPRSPTEATRQHSQATDRRVGETAEKTARLYLGPYQRQGRRQIVIQLVLAGFWLATGMLSIIDHSPRQALTPWLLAALFVGAAAWAWYDRRHVALWSPLKRPNDCGS